MSEETNVETTPSEDGSTETESSAEETTPTEQEGSDDELAQFLNDGDPDDIESEQLDDELAREETGKKPEAKDSKKPEAKKDEPRKFKVKIDGQEAEVDEAELVRGYQKGSAADKKFAEAASLQKSMAAFVEQLKKDPISILSDKRLGIDFRQIAESYLIEQLKMEQMTPAERELLDAKKKLTEYEKQQELTKKQAEEAQVAQLAQQYSQAIDEQFSAAIQKVGLPKTERTISLMADLAMRAEDTQTPWSPETVAEAVKRYLAQEKAEFLKTLTPDELREYVGQEKMGQMRKQDIQAAKSKQGSQKPKLSPQSPARKTEKQRHFITEDDLEQQVSERLGRKPRF